MLDDETVYIKLIIIFNLSILYIKNFLKILKCTSLVEFYRLAHILQDGKMFLQPGYMLLSFLRLDVQFMRFGSAEKSDISSCQGNQVVLGKRIGNDVDYGPVGEQVDKFKVFLLVGIPQVDAYRIDKKIADQFFQKFLVILDFFLTDIEVDIHALRFQGRNNRT